MLLFGPRSSFATHISKNRQTMHPLWLIVIAVGFSVTIILPILLIKLYCCDSGWQTKKESETDIHHDNPLPTDPSTNVSSTIQEETPSDVTVNVPPPLPARQYYSAECCACLDRRATVSGQCGHICWCGDCALAALLTSNDHHQTMTLRCPLCRRNGTLISAL